MRVIDADLLSSVGDLVVIAPAAEARLGCANTGPWERFGRYTGAERPFTDSHTLSVRRSAGPALIERWST